ncbi:MAG: hypothetical protein ACRDK7_02570 [Solirubrobacteraceae bacterium]
MSPAGSAVPRRPPDYARTLASRLTGGPFPEVGIPGLAKLRSADSGHDAHVLYIYPGSVSSPLQRQETPLADAEQHRAFRELESRWTDLRVQVIGLSSQSQGQVEAMTTPGLHHWLLSDPLLLLAATLDLPTFPCGAGRCYERTMLIIVARRITKVFYPVHTPGRSAEQILTWMRLIPMRNQDR